MVMSGRQGLDLTEGQKDCLRLVSDHFTSKEIARQLGISHFTVDQRLNVARKKLNAANRTDAAKLFASMEEGHVYERLVYQPHTVANNSDPLTLGTSPRQVGQHEVENTGSNIFSSQANTAEHESGFVQIRSFLSVPPIGGARHDLSKKRVIFSSLNIAFYATITVSILILVLTGVMRMIE
jgi:DNA-binding CsgD family transcriptional regulator